ncbi:MAG: DegT/DnrJ/EryC1/StrS family aminotransferase [Bdellovibrionota bacterium]
MKVPFSFLTEQFSDPEPIFDSIRNFLKRCDFTLGEDLLEFEKKYATYTGAKHAVGVGTGTDALSLSLKMLGVGAGDEVITPPNSFFATTGAIVQAGATPVFVDAAAGDLNIDVSQIEAAIGEKTKAIVPVHWAGCPADMPAIMSLAKKHGLFVVEDACQALGAKINGQHVGTFGDAAGFSCHPLKPLHVWGDGGVIITNSDSLAEKLRLYRNHGMEDRDTIRFWGVNSRFDNLHAIVGNYVFETLDETIETRIAHATRYDAALSGKELAAHLEVPKRNPENRHVFHLYKIQVKDRAGLLEHLKAAGVEAKIHYPTPLHLQPAAVEMGHKSGDFPVTEDESAHTMTYPLSPVFEYRNIDRLYDRASP